MSETTTKSYTLQQISESFQLASYLPAKESLRIFDEYIRYFTKKGKEDAQAYNVDQNDLFIRLGAYERFIAEYRRIPDYAKFNHRLVTSKDIHDFKTRMVPTVELFAKLSKLSIPQKFLIALTHELGFSMMDNQSNLQPILDMLFDLYDEEQSMVDGGPMMQKIERILRDFDFSAYEICVEEYQYSLSTYTSLFRPYFKKHNLFEREDVLRFMHGYAAVSGYRKLFSNHRNIEEYRLRAERFHVFLSSYTEKAIDKPAHRKLDALKGFVVLNPQGVEVLNLLVSRFLPHTNIYFAFLAYVDPMEYNNLFNKLESNLELVEELLLDLETFSNDHGHVINNFPRTGEEPVDMHVPEPKLITGEQKVRPSTPKVEIVPGENRLASITPEPSEQPHLGVIEESEPEPSDEPDQFATISEQVAYRRQQEENRSREITGKMLTLRIQIEKLELELMESQALISFYDTYTKNNPDS